MSTGRRRNMRLQQESATPIKLSGSGQLHHKPHRSRKTEVVKNMSSVPCYLQRPEKDDTLQTKALNFGVLDWGSLEKWTYLQKQAANRVGDSRLAQRDRSNDKDYRQRLHSTYDKTRNQTDKSREPGQRIFSDSSRPAENSLQEQCARIEGLCDHLQETVHKGRISCEFAVASKEEHGEVDRNSFSVAEPSSRVSYSCPFPSTADNNPSVHQSKQASRSAHEEEDEVAASSRRSPFKRMLNPLLKSKNPSQFSGPITTSCNTRDEVELLKGRYSRSNPSTSHVINCASRVQDAKNAISTKHALLKLAWKNGLPLFIFSTNDDDNILAATMGKRSIAEKSDFECIYTLFTAHEIKNKHGSIGKGQGNKLKKQGLVYNVVGQMKVSSSEFSTQREFVLFGDHLVPAGQPVKSLLNNELAAIVVKVPGRNSESSRPSTTCWKSPQVNLREESFSSIVAILPSGVHGLSTAGEPSPLIERWRYGGYCDCGGWDEGCILKVLTDKGKESSTPDGNESRCVELFNQGAGAKERVFTMIALKEGVYSVKLGPSIALLQAFAICIATLHSSTPTILAKLHCSAEAPSLQDFLRKAARKS